MRNFKVYNLKNWGKVDISINGFNGKVNEIPNSSGWYMIYCNVPISEFETLRKLKNRGAINISERVKNGKHLCSDLIIEENTSLNYCVYIGHQKNLNRRIKEHFKGSNGTGCLSIFKHQKLRSYKWKVLFYEIIKDKQLEDTNIFRTIIENNLRSKFGWPILCAR